MLSRPAGPWLAPGGRRGGLLPRLTWGLAAGLAVVYGIAWGDLILRARGAALKGRRHLDWAGNPAGLRASWDRRLAWEADRFQKDFKAGRIPAVERGRRLLLARWERERALGASQRGYARAWLESAAELLTPPESRWSALARRSLEELRQAGADRLE